MRHEKQTRLVVQRPGQGDDEVARLGRQRNVRIGIVEVDGAARHAGFDQGGGDGGTDGFLVPRRPLNRQEPEQTLDGRLAIEAEVIGGHG